MKFMTPGKHLAMAALFLLLLCVVALPDSVPGAAGGEARGALVCLLTLAAAGSGVLAWLGHRRLAAWTTSMAAGVARANQGDLTTLLPAAETAGGAAMALHGEINGLLEHFRRTIDNLQETSATIAAMSAHINDNSARLVGAVETQANGAIEATTTVQEVNASIERTVRDIDNLSRSSGEVSSAIMEMTASIEEVAGNMDRLWTAIEQVGGSITEMTASIHEIDGNVDTLNQSTHSAVSAVAQMDQSIRQVQESVQSAVGATHAVLQDAEAGKNAVDASIDGIRQIERSSMVALEAIGELSRRTASIDAIIKVIDEVAEQTNLLALNASIIAAQAGVHGRGFSVVAEEIKELAQKTKQSTHEIAEIIVGVQSETGRVDEVIRTTERHVRDGVERTTFSGNALEKIVDGVRQVNNQVAMIARATEEQATGSHSIRKSMESVAAMVSQISGAAREQSTTSDLIHASTEQMRTLAGQINAATREQSAASAVIAKLTEVMRTLMESARQSCHDQQEGSDRINTAVGIILESSDLNLDVARGMDEAVEKLGRHAQTLQSVSDFSV